MTDEYNDLDDVDAVMLARFLSGESKRGEIEAITRWMEAAPERRHAVDALRVVWTQAANPPMLLDVPASWAVIAEHLRPSVVDAKDPAPLRRSEHRRHTAQPTTGTRWWKPITAIAAALALAVAGTRWLAGGRASDDTASVAMREVATAKGQRAAVQLSDGTRILLAPDTKLCFPTSFGAQRDVYLEGEGYFDVAHNASRPFVVHASGAIARDIGTAFDVRAYPGDSTMQVVVTAGRVTLAPAQHARTAPASVLSRGQLGQLDLRTAHVTIQPVDTATYLAWRDGRLVFHNTQLREVIVQLDRWHDVDIKLGDPSLASRLLTASFDSESVTEAVQFMTVSLDLRSVRAGRTITLFPRHPNP